MQRAQRAIANPALNVAIEAGNLLGQPVVVYFQLLPRAPRANLRHYEFMRQGLEELGSALRKRKVGFVLARYPEQSLLRFCSEVKPCLVIGDENPMRDAEQRQSSGRGKVASAVLDRGRRRDRADAFARQGTLCRAYDPTEDPRAPAPVSQTLGESFGARGMARTG